ncbi:MAG: hypothetical protein R3F19_20620 [Verrucomicrobiales bacterium]
MRLRCGRQDCEEICTDGGGGHQQRFIDQVKEGKLAATHTALQGHLSAALAHMANTSYRMGSDVSNAEITEKLSGDKLAAETFERFKEHLTVNGLDVAEDQANPRLKPYFRSCEGSLHWLAGWTRQTGSPPTTIAKNSRSPSDRSIRQSLAANIVFQRSGPGNRVAFSFSRELKSILGIEVKLMIFRHQSGFPASLPDRRTA